MKTAQTIAQNTERSSVAAPTKGKRKQHPNSRANLVKPWEPGCPSPNPSGRPKDIAGEISRAAFENNRDAIYNAVAEKLLAGDAYAFSVHSDRGYGKLKQGVIHSGDEEGGPVRTSLTVRFVSADDNK